MNRLSIHGYDPLGENGSDGIRFAWKCESRENYIESAAFVNKTKGSVGNISGYTTSVSAGCILRTMGVACKFCRTGRMLPFQTPLTAKEIAKQNVFMVLADMNCEDHPKLRDNLREFAYMGQGEPGFSYTSVREAIRYTDRVMNELGQTVYRHIISTSGVLEAIDAIYDDIKNGFYSSRVTIHYSLHAAKNRMDIMPIERLYPFLSTVSSLQRVSELTGEKICLGMLLFNHFIPNGSTKEIVTRKEDVMRLLTELSPENFRFSFCEFNGSPELGTYDVFPSDAAQDICRMVQEAGFEAKLFSSFGKKEESACGMLVGKEPHFMASSRWKQLDGEAEKVMELL